MTNPSGADMAAAWEAWKAGAEFQSVGPNAALFARMTEADKKCIQGAMFLAFTQGWIDRDTLHRVGVDAEGSPGRDK